MATWWKSSLSAINVLSKEMRGVGTSVHVASGPKRREESQTTGPLLKSKPIDCSLSSNHLPMSWSGSQ